MLLALWLILVSVSLLIHTDTHQKCRFTGNQLSFLIEGPNVYLVFGYGRS
jgi:hypothetical protein